MCICAKIRVLSINEANNPRLHIVSAGEKNNLPSTKIQVRNYASADLKIYIFRHA
jgi:hypothetical protein